MSHSDSCGSYGPGHRMHWIQAKKSHEPGQPIINVKVVAVRDDGHFDIEGDGLKLELWHHDTTKLKQALRFGGNAEWKPRFHVLRLQGDGQISVAKPEGVKPCVPPIRRHPTETTRQFIEPVMGENYGCTVPQSWLVDLDAIPDGDTGEPQSGYMVGTNNPTPEERALMKKMREEFGGEEEGA